MEVPEAFRLLREHLYRTADEETHLCGEGSTRPVPREHPRCVCVCVGGCVWGCVCVGGCVWGCVCVGGCVWGCVCVGGCV